MGSPGWLGKKNFAKLFPSYKADSLVYCHHSDSSIWDLCMKLWIPKIWAGSERTCKSTAELGFHAASGRQMWPEAGSRLGMHAEVADLSRSLVWLVKCTWGHPGVLVLVWSNLSIPLHSHSGFLRGVCCLCHPLFELSIWLQFYL